MNRIAIVIVGTLLLLGSSASALINSLWSEQQKHVASDGAEYDFLGSDVSISGTRALIGAFGDDDNGTDSGSVYAIDRDGAGNWPNQQKLMASDGAAGDFFGDRVAMSGDVALIGANGDDDNGTNSGSAYIFECDVAGQWSQVQKLIASDGTEFDYFGTSVSISGDVAVIGSWGYNQSNDIIYGGAYIFERDGTGHWSEVQKLAASDAMASDFFGWRVAISGGTVLIGAYGDDDNGAESGSAYLFERNRLGQWVEVQKLIASDGAPNDLFGFEVSISGDAALIAATRDDDNGTDSGSAYLFERNRLGQWVEVQKLTASDGVADDYFGNSVSISGDTALIGAHSDDDNGGSSGSAYVFRRDRAGQWPEVQKLTASDGAANDRFGVAVSISLDSVLIGASGDDDNGNASGSVYIFERDEEVETCLGDINGDFSVNTDDFSEFLIQFGQVGQGLSADLDGDQDVDIDDFSELLINFGNTCSFRTVRGVRFWMKAESSYCKWRYFCSNNRNA